MTKVVANTSNKEMTNVKVSVDSKKEELTITIPLKGFSVEEVLNGDLTDTVKFPRTGKDDDEKALHERNIKVASTNGIISVTSEKYETIQFQVNAWHSIKQINKKLEMKRQRELAATITGEQQAKATPVGDPTLEPLKALVKDNPELIKTLPADLQLKVALALAGL